MKNLTNWKIIFYKCFANIKWAQTQVQFCNKILKGFNTYLTVTNCRAFHQAELASIHSPIQNAFLVVETAKFPEVSSFIISLF